MEKCVLQLIAGAAMVLALVPAGARADSGTILFGQQARQLGMAGAGVALDDRTDDYLNNPALLAGRKGLKLQVPTFGIDGYQGPSLGDVLSKLGSIGSTTSGSSSSSNLTSLAGIFINRPGTSSVSASIELGLGYGPFALSGLGRGSILGAQGPTQDPAGPPGTSNIYTVKAGYEVGPVVSYGMHVPNPIGRDREPMKVGVNLRFPQEQTFTQVFSVVNTAGTRTALPIGNLVKSPTHSSFGADVGLLMKPMKRLTYGLVIQNAITPNLPGTTQSTLVNTGVAYHLPTHLVLAADLDNVTGAYNGNPDFRAGAEWKPVPFFSLRGGFSNQGIAVGAGLFGFDIAYSPNNQQVNANILHIGM